MRESIKDVVGDAIQDLLNSGIKTSFTEKELKEFGIKVPGIEINAQDIQKIREQTKLSQTVFARILNVSPSSVRQWEQGKRNPSGSTQVLLELLQKNPSLLNYRISSLYQNTKT